MNWNIDGKTFRVATTNETTHDRNVGGAPHVLFGCLCGAGHWSSKNISLSAGGQYNGARNIFYYGDEPECSCNSRNLRHIVCEETGTSIDI
jgi:hypothetical protein